MLRLFSTRAVHSDKNGEILVKRWFSQTEVFVDDYLQSGPYIKTMWRKAVRRVPSTARIESVLLLGLGGGSAINEVHARFPSTHITVLEWDPVMVDLAHELKLFPDSIKLDLLIGDAVELLPLLTRKFDLVLIDLFKGETPEPRLSTPAMIISIAQVLNPSGHIILNAFKGVSLIEAFARYAEHLNTWRFRYNRLALYRPFS